MKANQAMSFAGLLAQNDGDPKTRSELLRQTRRMLLPLALVAALVATWSVTAPLSGAVVANGQVKVELNRKTVQHQEGGIVREILVRDGQHVRAGQPLVVVGDVRSDAELSLLQDQFRAARVRSARAEAEASLQIRFALPADLAGQPETAGHFAREHTLFTARRRTLDEQVVALEKQIREANAQAAALESQIAATENSARYSTEELEINNKLVRDGFISRARMLELQRGASDYSAKVGEYRSDLAMAHQRAGELEARIAQARNQYQQQAADELKDASAKAREIEERLRPSQDQVERQIVRSPVDGEVMSMHVSAIGEVLGPRQPILDVVPGNEKLVIEARIHPQDIDHVHKDAPAEVRLSAFDARTVPMLPAKVLFVSPDRVTQPETNESWFVATIEVDAASLKNYPQVHLQAGMPAELFVTTPDRTLFQYLTKPLNLFAARAMREP
ncbi:MAG: HlyD family type I secretion periplasmic adaptor subunit [Betaproteobacteria bacterium]|jgi:HlyD family type I secretion membrane fusion protein